MKLTRLATLTLAAVGCVHAAYAGDRDALIATATTHERGILSATVEAHPLVETYLQFTPAHAAAPQQDAYSLATLGKGKTFTEAEYQREYASDLKVRLLKLGQDLSIGKPEEVKASAFADMISPDASAFTASSYRFDYQRTVFVGARRMVIYDVAPIGKKVQYGRFLGRIWVDEHDGVIARFNGTFIGSAVKAHPTYLHFDSWRRRSASGEWLPYAIYIEDSARGAMIHGQLRFWGYHLDRLNRARDSSETHLTLDGARDESTTSADVGPLEAASEWRNQAETNLLDRLEEAGLLAPAGDFEKILDQIVINLQVPSNLDFGASIHCRVLLSLPVEATVADHTILLSKGLVDTIPTEEALASVLALELAHIQLGHRLDTRYAFSDRMMFTNPEAYERISLRHSAVDDAAAGAAAKSLLAASLYGGKMPSIAAYYALLEDASRRLPSRTHGYLGDSLVASDSRSRFDSWIQRSTVQSAYATPLSTPLPLSSTLSVDPESDTLHQILPCDGQSTKADMHSFEILPVQLYYRLDDDVR